MKNIIVGAVSSSLLVCALAMPPAVLAESGAQQKTTDSQGNNKADVALTAEIRKAIVADKSLSVSAHNVKIITQNGVVTLRGAVSSDAEKDTVLSKAKFLAGANGVIDRLTVSPK